ncbi:MAG: hypothetical protein AB1631_31655 [Acidobacteriota bacterium]
MELIELLSAIGSTEPSSFGEFCSSLGADRPEQGDRPAWSALFRELERAERDGLVEIERDGRGRIDSLMLTSEGAARIRDMKDRERPLLPTWER